MPDIIKPLDAPGKQIPHGMPDITASSFRAKAMSDKTASKEVKELVTKEEAAQIDKAQKDDIRPDMWEQFQACRAEIAALDKKDDYKGVILQMQKARNILKIS